MGSALAARAIRLVCLAAGALCFAARGEAQTFDTPLTFGNGRVALGGDVSATFSCTDAPGTSTCGEDTGFFNYSDYERSTVRMLRINVNTAIRAGRRLSFLAELRSENGSVPTAYALFARISPWTGRNFDLQIGRVPPTFGAFARRTYASDNLLIGYPLAYQYLTPLRPDALPSSAQELASMRGRGWLSNFTIGEASLDHGLPLVSVFRWDTGIQAHTTIGRFDAAASVTTGSLGNPLIGDDNAGKQIAGRLSAKPLTGLVVGASAARGSFLTRDAARAAGVGDRNGDFTQTAFGADLEYSRDYYVVRWETVVSRWTLPTIADRLSAVGTSVEGRYKIVPGLYAAARFDRLGFSQLALPGGSIAWDAPVTRIEVGGGYSVRRNLQLKVSAQRNVRDAGRVQRLNLVAAQTVFWF